MGYVIHEDALPHFTVLPLIHGESHIKLGEKAHLYHEPYGHHQLSSGAGH